MGNTCKEPASETRASCTNCEKFLPDGRYLVSKTDLEGIITYCNDAFIEVSGFSREELIGKSHNRVRHPDMPPAAFKDLWDTIKAGRPWRGILKNRCKNGDHYWVDAFVVPIRENDRIVGYMSARSAPSRPAVAAAEAAYRAQPDGNAGLDTAVPWWKRISIRARLLAIMIFMGIMLAVGAAIGILGNFQSNAAFERVNESRMKPIDQIGRITALMIENARQVAISLQHDPASPFATTHDAPVTLHTDSIIRNRDEINALVADFEARVDDASLKSLLADYKQARAEYVQNGLMAARDKLLAGDFVHANRIFVEQVNPLLDQAKDRAHEVQNALLRAAESEYAAARERYLLFRNLATGGTVLALLMIGLAAWNLSHAIVVPLRRIIGHFDQMSQGNLTNEIDITGRDEVGRVLTQLATMQVHLKVMLDEIQFAARTMEQRYAFAVEGAGDGVWDWDLRTGAMPLSGNYEGMLGYAKGEITATIDAWVANVHPEDLPRIKATLDEYLAGALPAYTVELRLRCKDGAYKWILCRGAVVERDADEKPVRMIGIHSDLSMYKAVESALIEARETAERANRAKSDFLSSMSHELRTPMNAIIGFAQILEYDGMLTADQQDSVREILKAGRHLLDLMNDVLDLAKIESGHISLSMEGVDLAALGEECRQLMQPIAQQAGIRLGVDLRITGTVFADRVRLKQVLINLLSNAIKYNRPPGQVTLTASAGSPGHLRIAVTDTGPGIPPERIAQLFQPFNRLGAEGGSIEGTGIGLTITHRLVQMMGGTIGVESAPGVGSTFSVELATGHTAENGAGGTGGDTQDAGATAAGREAATVLAIDDNPANLKLIAQVMGMRQHIHLLSAHTPEFGIELALARRPDLILLDINMPGMDGYQVLKVFQSHAVLRSIPVVAVTANALPCDIERGRAAGFADYLTKPLDIAKLLDRIDRCLANTERT
jgi:PAS domain S-box-containing protein